MDRMTSTVRVFARAKPEDKLEIWVDGFDLISGWWFQILFYVHPYLGKMNPFWLIFFRWVETTNKIWFEGSWIDWMMKDFFIPWYLRMSFSFLWRLKHKSANSFGVLDFEFSVSALSQPRLKFESRLKPISWSLKENGSTQQPNQKKWKHTTTNWKKKMNMFKIGMKLLS